MALHFVVGCSGSGKTHHMYETMIQRSIESPNQSLLLIVPEQFTLQTQQELVQAHPQKGIMQLEVLSFQRLAYRLYDDMSLSDKKLLNDTGKSMAIRRMIEISKDNYPFFAKQVHKKGYINELKAMMTEVSQYAIKKEDLEKIGRETGDPLLDLKLKDLTALVRDYEDFVSKNYFTTESIMTLLVDVVDGSEWISKTEILIDGFYGFTPVQYEIIRRLTRRTKGIYISLTGDLEYLTGSRGEEADLFYETKKVYERMCMIAKEEDVQVKHVHLNGNPARYAASPVLKHLERQLYRFPYVPYTEPADGLTLGEAVTMRKECRYVADSIMRLVMEKGYRYKEIAILTGDLNGYESLLKQTLSKYQIPFFLDQKKSILANPFVVLILAFLEAITKDFAYESVFRYLKTGLLDFNDEELDFLDNYVLAYGLRGISAWDMQWDRPYPYMYETRDSMYHVQLLEKINDLRIRVIKPFIQFKENVSRTDTVKRFAKNLYNWIEFQGMEAACQAWADVFEQQGRLDYQKAYQQIYKKIIDVLNQAVDILGEQSMTLKQYHQMLETGFEACEMALVPPGLDQVVVGDLERSRIKETKALFVIGFNEGKVPKPNNQTGFITDPERCKILELGFEIAPDQRTNLFAGQLGVYAGLLRVKERLYISYSKSDTQGKSMRPSLLFKQIKKLFPESTTLDLEEIYLHKLVVNRPEPTFEQLISRLMQSPLQKSEIRLPQVYRWFYENPSWQSQLLKTEKALVYNNEEPRLSEEWAGRLYMDTLVNSVSRLEAFAGCPFAHFMDYGLKLKERLDYSIKMPDIGILFHKAIDLCSKEMTRRSIAWEDSNPEQRDLLVEMMVQQVVSDEPRGIFKNSSRNNYLVRRLTRITKRAMQAIAYQIAKGDFRPIAFEQSFDGAVEDVKSLNIDFGNSASMKLTGRMDRLDGFRDESNLYLTVVDYKSGSRSFDLLALYYGLQLQLFVYLNAAIEVNALSEGQNGRKVKPAGVFYFHIDDPLLQEAEERDPQLLEKKILKALKLKGLVLDDQEIIRRLDSALEKSSDVIPVTLTADGTPAKNASVISAKRFDSLRNYAQHQVIDIGKNIIKGHIQVQPYKKKNETACDYCSYLPVCRFEKGVAGNNYKCLELLSKEEIFEKIDTKGAEVFGGSH